MSKLLVSTVCAILALPVTALADDDRPAQHHQQSGWHGSTPNRGGEHHYDRDDHDRDHDGGSRYYGNASGQHHYGYSPAQRYYAQPVRYYTPTGRYYAAPVRYYAPPPRYYGPAPNYYYGGHNHHDHDNDDALWAIGGLVLGAVIGHAVEHSSATTSSSSTTHHTPSCKDTVAYDSDGNPYVKRDCN